MTEPVVNITKPYLVIYAHIGELSHEEFDSKADALKWIEDNDHKALLLELRLQAVLEDHT